MTGDPQHEIRADDEGLVAQYTFAEGRGQVLHDRSATQAHGRVCGAAWVNGGCTAALDFDGSCDYVDCGDDPRTRPAGSLTVSAWVRPIPRSRNNGDPLGFVSPLAPSAVVQGRQVIVSRDDWNLCIEPDGTPVIEVRRTTGTPWDPPDALRGRRALAWDRWTHLSAVWDADQGRVALFVNGRLESEMMRPRGSLEGVFGSKLILGAAYAGLMGNVQLYARTLSAEEVRRLYRRAIPDPSVAPLSYRLGIRSRLFFRSRTIRAELYLRSPSPASHPANLRAELRRQGETCAPGPVTAQAAPGARDAFVNLPLPEPAPGDYEVRAVACDASDNILAEASCVVTVPEKPWWFDSDVGREDVVLSPLTPLEVEHTHTGEKVFACWGRRHAFGKTPFPQQIISAGRPILAAPVRLTGQVGGRAIQWTGEVDRWGEDSPVRAVFSHSARAGGLDLTVDSAIEYDGLMRFDCTLTPCAPVRIESLALEIPLRREHARLVYFYRDALRLAPGAVPDTGIVRSFNPAIWLGDEERGLQWFMESDQNWHSADPERAIEIVPQGNATVLRLNLITASVLLASEAQQTPGSVKSLAYTFGLQATPVKPVLKDAWDYRAAPTLWDDNRDYILWYGDDYALLTGDIAGKPGLDYLRERGVRTLFLSSFWTEIFAYPACIGHEEDLHRLVKACHARGMQVIVYCGSLFSELTPEYPAFLGDFAACRDGAQPGAPTPVMVNCPPKQRTQATYIPCVGSDWSELVAAGVARLMDTYNIDGIYLDGYPLPELCANHAHGCGYLRADGSVGTTYPFFKAHAAMRRLYRIVKSRKPDGQVDLHPGAHWLSPVMTWATNCWDGETILGGWQTPPTREGRHLLDYLPLDMFRAQFMGRPWGVSTEFIDFYVPYSYRRQHAMTLLHDIPIRPHTHANTVDFAARLWQVMDEFGRKEAEWLPYWKNSAWVVAQPEGAYVSLYRHSKNGVLAVASNLGRQPATLRLVFNLANLGFQGDPKALDALTREEIPCDGGAMSLDVDSVDWRLIWLKPHS